MNPKKLHISQNISNLECSIFKLCYQVMCNLYTKFVRFLEICKHFSNGLVTEKGNILRPGPVPRFSDLEVIALSMAAESEEIDSENWLFESISRGKRCKMGTNGDYAKAPDFGYCASQGIYFFGYKLHALCGLSGVIHSYELSKASVHDINYLKDIRQVYHDCNLPS